VQISLPWEDTVNREARPASIPKNLKFTNLVESIQMEQSSDVPWRDGTHSHYLHFPFSVNVQNKILLK
jgi:hypothetical protein